MILFILSLLAGFLTVLAPCTIALLPVIVGGSIGGAQNSRRTMVVTVSLGISVILFTLLLKVSTSLITIPQYYWQFLSGGIVFILGILTLFPTLWESIPFVGALNRGSNQLIATGYQKNSLWGDAIIGAALGPVFSSCSPTYFLILATVLPRSFSAGMLYLLAYTAGLSITLFIVARAGQQLLMKLGVSSDPSSKLKRTFGVIFLLVGLAIITGYDKRIELYVANHVFDVTRIEQQLLVLNPEVLHSKPAPSQPLLLNENGTTTSSASTTTNADMQSALIRTRAKAASYLHAPEITMPSGFINTDGKPITFSQFKNKKVILVDFWTYSCINCQRTIPYLVAWDEKYRDAGLQIIGIHTPEFGFEKVYANVENAVKGFGMKYPIVLDNDYGTWNAFGNNFWPRKYLIDIDGYIVFDHAGEGNYDETEQAIQKALTERSMVLGADRPEGGVVTPSLALTSDAGSLGSPETYFGSDRNKYLANGTRGLEGIQEFTYPKNIELNRLNLSGRWNIMPEFAQSTASDNKIIYKYKAKDVYLVASGGAGATIRISVDGAPPTTLRGDDIAKDGIGTIKENRLYRIIHGADYAEHTLQIEVLSGTLDAYTFTFG